MLEVTPDASTEQQISKLLVSTEEASTELKALRFEYDARSLLWCLEAHGKLSILDADNLRALFQVALEKRLLELTSG